MRHAVHMILVALAAAAASVLLVPAPAGAHPLGNFTTNSYAGLRIQPDRVLVDYVVDLAEIPAFRAMSDIDTDGDDDLSKDERRRYRTAECDGLADGLDVAVDGRALAMAPQSSRLSFPPGQAGLDLLRLECTFTGSMAELEGETTVTLADGNLAGRLGWREVTAVGDRMTLVGSDVPESSVSDRLTSYPKNQLSSPLRQRSATLRVEPGGPAARGTGAPASGEQAERPATAAFDSFSNLVDERRLTVGFGLAALGIAFVLGTFHALAPGHGKTVMAAYLVGQRGSRRQALGLGLTVAVTHTGGVSALALVVSNSSLAPEGIYPWLGAISGLLVVAIGVSLTVRAVRFRHTMGSLGHSHGFGGHHHGFGGHDHGDVALVGAGREMAPGHASGAAADLVGVDLGHDHVAGHDHAGHGHDHAAHVHDGPDHVHDGHDHVHDGHDQVHAGHDHVGHDRVHAGQDHAGHDHDGHDHADGHGGNGAGVAEGGQARPIPNAPSPMRRRNLMAMGFAGGMVPSPSALVVLLGAIALGRAWFGFLLITAYGLGMAATLVTAGLVLERARSRIERLLATRSSARFTRVAGALPLVTAVLVVLGGILVTARALTA